MTGFRYRYILENMSRIDPFVVAHMDCFIVMTGKTEGRC